MSDTSKFENARAAREARDTVAARPAGSSTPAIAAAMRRYLSAEQYHELREADAQAVSEQDPTDQDG